MRHIHLVRAAALLLPLCSCSFGQWRCTSQTVRGTWAYQGRGTVMMNVSGNPVAVPFTGVGIGKIDPQGGYTVHATMAAGGQVAPLVPLHPDFETQRESSARSLRGISTPGTRMGFVTCPSIYV